MAALSGAGTRRSPPHSAPECGRRGWQRHREQASSKGQEREEGATEQMLQQVTNPVQCVLASEVPCCVGSGVSEDEKIRLSSYRVPTRILV